MIYIRKYNNSFHPDEIKHQFFDIKNNILPIRFVDEKFKIIFKLL